MTQQLPQGLGGGGGARAVSARGFPVLYFNKTHYPTNNSYLLGLHIQELETLSYFPLIHKGDSEEY